MLLLWEWSWCPHVRILFYRHLSLNMWTYFSISAFAWGQARSKLGGVDTSILHHAFISIFIALWAVITHYVTILMPFLSYFTRFTWRGRMPATGISGLEKEQILETYSAQLQKSWNSTEVSFGIYKKYWAKKVPEGGHQPATRVEGAPPTLWAPCQASGAHLLLYGVFWPGKNQKEAFETKRRRLEAEPGQNKSRAPAELFYRGNFPPGWGNRSHHHHQPSSHREGVNIHQHLHQHHLLSNPSSSLVSNLCSEASDWYMWVASSVDYSL